MKFIKTNQIKSFFIWFYDNNYINRSKISLNNRKLIMIIHKEVQIKTKYEKIFTYGFNFLYPSDTIFKSSQILIITL